MNMCKGLCFSHMREPGTCYNWFRGKVKIAQIFSKGMKLCFPMRWAGREGKSIETTWPKIE